MSAKRRKILNDAIDQISEGIAMCSYYGPMCESCKERERIIKGLEQLRDEKPPRRLAAQKGAGR